MPQRRCMRHPWTRGCKVVNTPSSNATLALQKRVQALALLEEAAALDQLKPFAVTHRHRFGESTYLCWSAWTPSEEEAASICDGGFDPELDEYLSIEETFTLEEMAGVKGHIAQHSPAEPDSSPSP